MIYSFFSITQVYVSIINSQTKVPLFFDTTVSILIIDEVLAQKKIEHTVQFNDYTTYMNKNNRGSPKRK